MYHKSLLPTLLALFFTVQAAAQELYVGSYNIRYKNGDDAANGNAWQQRCPVLCDQVNFEHPDVVVPRDFKDARMKKNMLSVKLPAKSIVVLTLK